MNYAGFQTALRGMNRGPSNTEVLSWLTGGGLMGLAERMRQDQAEKRDDYWKGKEFDLRKGQADNETQNWLSNQNNAAADLALRKQLQDFNLGTTKTQYPDPSTFTTALPDPNLGTRLLAPRQQPFSQAPHDVLTAPPLPTTVHTPGYLERMEAIAAQNQNREAQVSQANIDHLNALTAKINDPNTTDLERQKSLAEITLIRANAGEAAARSGFLSTQAAQVSTGKQAKWDKIMDIYHKTFMPDATTRAIHTQDHPTYDPSSGLVLGAPSPEQWLRTWPAAFKSAYGITDEDIATPGPGGQAPATGGAPTGSSATKVLTDPAIGMGYLQKAGNDPAKARQLAAQDGWSF